MIVDAVTRLIPGALGNEDSALNESFSEADEAMTSGAKAPSSKEALLSRLKPRPTKAAAEDERGLESHFADQESRATKRGILDFPHYTRPQSFRGWDVPEVLMSGNHEEIRRWRREQALEKTLRNRPDLLNERE
jgi:tRNA (guanine37-N1)-methyltransferase